jgi:hypothetical protein
MPASLAIARRCKTVLVEPPMAISTAKALSKASMVRISLGFMSFSNSSMIFLAAVLASSSLLGSTAGMVPLPGNPRPKASVMQFIELAVNIPRTATTGRACGLLYDL